MVQTSPKAPQVRNGDDEDDDVEKEEDVEKKEGPTPDEIEFQARTRARWEAGVATQEAVESSCRITLEPQSRALPALAGSKHGIIIAHMISTSFGVQWS